MIEIGNSDNPKVLIVDDETEVLNSLSDLLRKDFHVYATSDVDQARRLLVSENMFSIVISDQRMPLVTGVELLAEATETSPDTARILLTGYADIEAVIVAVNQGRIVQYITKPWDPARLLEILKPLAQKHLLLQENRRLLNQLAHLNQSVKDSASRIEELETAQSSMSYENRVIRESYDQLQNSFWHLRKIQEVLPICMGCGKVKTDEASWEDVVDYLKSNALFLSHGYCPECAEKMNREWFGQKKKEVPA
jgi:response regulator RpfG family c-di-GMP phosphodiesterase